MKPISRKISIICLLAICSCLLAVVGCADSSVKAGYTFPAGQVEIDNDELEVYFASNSATGGQWTVSIEGDGLHLQDTEFESINEDTDENDQVILGGAVDESPAIGAGGTECFEFKGTGAGKQTLTFVSRHPSEDVSGQSSDDAGNSSSDDTNRQSSNNETEDQTFTMKTVTDAKGFIVSSEIMNENGTVLGSSHN